MRENPSWQGFLWPGAATTISPRQTPAAVGSRNEVSAPRSGRERMRERTLAPAPGRRRIDQKFPWQPTGCHGLTLVAAPGHAICGCTIFGFPPAASFIWNSEDRDVQPSRLGLA